MDTKLQTSSESCTYRFLVTVTKFVRIGHNSAISSRKDIKEAYVAKIVAKIFRYSKMRTANPTLDTLWWVTSYGERKEGQCLSKGARVGKPLNT